MGYINSGQALTGNAAVAKMWKIKKATKYKRLTAQQEADFFAFGAESSGGLGTKALEMLKVLGSVGQDHLAMWPRYQIVRHMLGSVAVCLLLCIRKG